MVKYVYIDVLFVTNMVVNYLLLLATGKLAARERATGRLVAASAVGALYASLAVAFPEAAAYSLPARLFFGLFMVGVAFPCHRIQSFLTVAVCFYLCSAITAGTAMALFGARTYIFVKSPVLATGSTVRWWMVALSLVFVAVVPIVARGAGFRLGTSLPLFPLELQIGGKVISLVALVDTGNNLRDPVSGLPVVVIDWEPLKRIMPSEISAFFSAAWEKMPPGLSDTPIGKRLRLIPYESLSGRKGVIPGFRPDQLVILGKGGRRVKRDAIVGVSGERLSASGLYQALLHPDLMDLS